MSYMPSWGYDAGDPPGEQEVTGAPLENQFRSFLSVAPVVSQSNTFKIHRIDITGDFEDRSAHVVK